jgi:uncharacterized protein YecE (DUF72 family)
MAIHIGTSGWSYDHWRGVLYPHEAPARERLSYHINNFRTVEPNSSYYRWPRDASFRRWQRYTPENFILTVKAPRSLTHAARLYGPERWVEYISLALETPSSKRGVLLVQLPPQFPCDCRRLDYFLRQTPPIFWRLFRR